MKDYIVFKEEKTVTTQWLGRIDAEHECYILNKGKAKPKPISFKYVEWASVRLSEYCAAEGVDVMLWHDNMKGTIEGLKVYIALNNAVEFYCTVRGIVCYALCDKRLLECEGFGVCATLLSGGKHWHYKGECIIKAGKGIARAFVLKEGSKVPRYIKCMDLVSVELL